MATKAVVSVHEYRDRYDAGCYAEVCYVCDGVLHHFRTYPTHESMNYGGWRGAERDAVAKLYEKGIKREEIVVQFMDSYGVNHGVREVSVPA